LAAGAFVALVLTLPSHASHGIAPDRAAQPADVVLAPTPHPRLTPVLSRLWFAPDQPHRVSGTELSAAMRQVAQGEYARALPVLSRPSAHEGLLGPYAMYDMAVSLLNLGRPEEARRAFRTIQAQRPVGYLIEAAGIGEAESNELLGDWPDAVEIYERLLKGKPLAPDDVLMRLGRAARRAGDAARADEAFRRVYYEFPLGTSAPDAAAELASVLVRPIEAGSDRYKLERVRAERLFGARQYSPALTAFQGLRPSAKGDDRELVALRIAQCHYHLKRLRDAREGLRPLLQGGTRQAEALYFYGLTLRGLGSPDEYISTLRRVAADFPKESWSGEALNNLATYHIRRDEDTDAEAIFLELLEKQPAGLHAERAAWRVGWWAYRDRRYQEAVRVFDRAAARSPRSDYRPAWLYWSGKAYEALENMARARERYELLLADYLNSYYGRLALKRPGVRPPVARVIAGSEASLDDDEAPGHAAPPPNAALVRALTEAGLHDKALSELRYAQRTWGDSSAIQATLAWVSYQLGIAESGNERFALLRGSITTMRRAYPQFMAAGGEDLPREILTVIFPLAYWDQIRQHSTAYKLDPYLMAALMAQESTFVADVRSAANAVGLMQLIPPTARQMAKRLGLRYSPRLLTDPEANIRMGMAYFAEKMQEFGAVHLALASYNAGERPVRLWMAERPGLDADEFTDDIPYPETQNYVKRIIGTAEDYRRLYGK
jgi:soluble lytic murein transglycosylase